MTTTNLPTRNNYINNNPYNPSHNKNAKPSIFCNEETTQKEQVKCWECGEPHYFKDCAHRNKNNRNIHTVREATTVGEIARSTPNISVALENKKEDHQASMVEIEGMLNNQSISILIDIGAILSYVSPKIVENCKPRKEKN